MSTAATIATRPETEESRGQRQRVKDVCKKLKIKTEGTITVPLDEKLNGGPLGRIDSRAVTGSNTSLVSLYADLMDSGTYFPPIVVFKYEDWVYTVDGRQREAAARSLGRTTIEAIVVQFTSKADMIALAGALNGGEVGYPSPQSKEDFMSMIKAWDKLKVKKEVMVRFLGIAGLPGDFADDLVKTTCQKDGKTRERNFKNAVKGGTPFEEALVHFGFTAKEGVALLAKVETYPSSVFGMHLAQMGDKLIARFAKLVRLCPEGIPTALASMERELNRLLAWVKVQKTTFRG